MASEQLPSTAVQRRRSFRFSFQLASHLDASLGRRHLARAALGSLKVSGAPHSRAMLSTAFVAQPVSSAPVAPINHSQARSFDWSLFCFLAWQKRKVPKATADVLQRPETLETHHSRANPAQWMEGRAASHVLRVTQVAGSHRFSSATGAAAVAAAGLVTASGLRRSRRAKARVGARLVPEATLKSRVPVAEANKSIHFENDCSGRWFCAYLVGIAFVGA